MIDLKDLKNGNYSGYSYTNSNSVITLIVTGDNPMSFMCDMENIKSINIDVGVNSHVEFAEIHHENKEELVIERKIKVEGFMKHEIIYLSQIKNNESLLNTKVKEDGKYDLIVLDFNNGSNKYEHNILMHDQGNESRIFCASVVEEKYTKYIKNMITNKVSNTTGLMENFGVSFDEGRLEIEGIGNIEKYARQAVNKQKSTMFVMDRNSKAISKPLLLIDEDDVVANHASAVGQISQDTIFYLCSRGIEEAVARKLIVMGYFKPFIEMIEMKEVHEELEDYLNEVINNV